MYYIGVDLGTSAVKLLLMEGDGKIVNIVTKCRRNPELAPLRKAK